MRPPPRGAPAGRGEQASARASSERSTARLTGRRGWSNRRPRLAVRRRLEGSGRHVEQCAREWGGTLREGFTWKNSGGGACYRRRTRVAAARATYVPSPPRRELVAHGARVLVWWAATRSLERRMWRRSVGPGDPPARGDTRPTSPVFRGDPGGSVELLRAASWPRLRRDLIVASPAARGTFARPPARGGELRVPKLVLVDAAGRVLAAAPKAVLVDDTVSRRCSAGQAEWSGLAIPAASGRGARAIRAESKRSTSALRRHRRELFTYSAGEIFRGGDLPRPPSGSRLRTGGALSSAGSGGAAQAREPEETAESWRRLRCEDRATPSGRRGRSPHAPYEAEGGEIVGLYTSLAKGEGSVSDSVSHLLLEAEARDWLDLCLNEEEAGAVLRQRRFTRRARRVPSAKWCGYERAPPPASSCCSVLWRPPPPR